jgi:RNA polymerase-binding transcription factor DksA
MDTATLTAFKSRLEAEEQKLLTELQTVGRINPDNPNDWEAIPSDMQDRSTDLNDFADNIEAYETNAAVLKQLETQLVDVRDALAKMENGTYGICEISGTPIELERLEANPAARTCVAHMNDR